LEAMSGRTVGESATAAKAAHREDWERDERTRLLMREMDELRLQVAVSDSTSIHKARAKVRDSVGSDPMCAALSRVVDTLGHR
jgi:cobalamin biosynthesis protein CbiD